ncbi:PREDICTED: delta-type opioid receptor-like [Branchiostoma belcheri]|uniref:Delta-type opioid receptor-like n=1 Tax=Branchiostoma belcheri TaxID=7741 RepID=A0A6P5AGC6_BRABE|nr:PREDICTED: delta-type opioid receptor-like [Branchiostoma belcheri]
METNGSSPDNFTWLNDTDGPLQLEAVEFSESFRVGLSIVLGTVFAVGVTGNLVTILWIALRGQPNNTMRTYVLSLSAADLAYLLGGPFYLSSFLMQPKWIYGEFGCRVIVSLDILTLLASILTLTVTSVDRFLAVVYPIKTLGCRSVNSARLSVVCVWLVSFVLSLPIAVFARMDTDEFPENCVIDWPSENSKRSYMTATFVLAFPVPLLVVSVCYGRMVTKLCTAVAPTSNSSKSNKDKRRVAKMVLAVTVMFYVCWLPFGVLQLLYYHSALPAHSSILYVQISLVGLTYLNSSAHPIIYLCVRERKKKKARTTVTRLRGRRTAEVSPTSPDGEMHPVATVSYAF